MNYLLPTLVVLVSCAVTALAQTNSLPAELGLKESVDLALRQNPAILKSQQELRRTRGLIVEARSYVLPHLSTSGDLTQIDAAAIDRFPGTGGTLFDNQQTPWNIRIEATQLLYAGGKIMAGIRAAKLADEAALLDFRRTVADTVLAVRKAFYQILLAQQQVVVREQSVKLLSQQLADARHRFEAGDVPQFNVLRAEVELANAKPPLIRAQNSLRLARESLVKLLAIDSRQDFTPIRFTGQLAFIPSTWQLPAALAEAVAKRPEIQVAQKQSAISREETVIARAGFKPELSLFGGYRVFNSSFADNLDNTRDGWLVGIRANWNLFDGDLTHGKLTQARARQAQADLDLADIRRTIELEVRQAYSDYLQAGELLDAQKKTVEQATESLRLAEARFRAGAGTQLDVLSAQTALTEARSNEAQALYDHNVALATLERVTGRTAQP